MTKRTSLLIVLSLIAALLVACTGTNNGGSSPALDSGERSNQNSSNESTSDDELVTLSLFINHSWYPVRKWEGSIAEEITKRTGVKLDVTVATDDQQLPLMIASGDLPDLVFTLREPRLENSDMSYAWNELIDQYAPNFDLGQARIAVNTAQDSNVYTVLNAFATPEEWESNPYALGNDGNPGIAVRQDILDELGVSEIQTIDDFTAVLEQVKSQYPDMVPLTMDIEWIPQYFRMQYGIPPHSSWYEQDGKLRHVITHPQMLEFYKFMNSLYRHDYILAENFTYSNDQIDDEYAITGRAFAHSHTVSIAEADMAKAANQGNDYTFTMIPSVLTDQAYNLSTGTGFSGVYISKNNSNPEKSIQFLEFLASKEGLELVMFGIEGEHWQWHADGYPVFNYDVNDADYINSEGLKWWYLYSDAIVEGLRGYVPGTQTTKALQEIKEITDYKPSIGMVKIQDGSDERVIFDKIDEMIVNEQIKIYLAETEEGAEQAYHNMVRIAEDIGLHALESWATEEFAKKRALFE